MATSYGWTGKILRVDLTTGKITETPTSDYVPKLIGGRGIASMIYWEEVPPECKAFDPENAVIMMTGPAVGTLSPSASKTFMCYKSPVAVKESYSWSAPGGHWGAELKFAGYDGIVIKGKSPKPVYLWINDGKAELRSADRLWGKLLSDMMLELYNQHGPQTRILGIGPAGENLVRQAPIIVDREHATGISGGGAVMGSKNLKAIAVRGTGAVNVAKPKDLVDLWYYYFRLLNRQPGDKEWPNTVKSLSYYMWHSPHIPYSKGHPPKPTDPAVYFKNRGLDEPISLMREAVDKGTVKLKWGGCWACPVCCAMVYHSTDVDIPSGSGQCNDMESWPAWEWAGYKKVIGIPSIWFNRWIDDLGLSITNAPAYHEYWIMELLNLGIITPADLGFPLVPTPNSTFAQLPSPWTLEFIQGFLTNLAYRKGDFYNQLAEGQERFLKALSEKNPAAKPTYDRVIARPGYSLHWSDDTRSGPTVGAIYAATQSRQEINKVTGLTHKDGLEWTGLTTAQQNDLIKLAATKYLGSPDAVDIAGQPQSWKNKAHTAILFQNYSVNMDCITMCGWANCPPFFTQYKSVSPDYLGDPALGAKVYSAITGIDMTNEQMLDAMNPINNIERCIHVREGRRRENDWYNDATFKTDAWKWTSPDEFSKALDEYYNDPARGWDLKTGIPRRSTLEKQGLKKIADELESKYKITVPA